MSAAIIAPVEQMSEGQLRAAVTLLRDVARLTRKYFDAEERAARGIDRREPDRIRADLNRAMTKVGLP